MMSSRMRLSMLAIAIVIAHSHRGTCAEVTYKGVAFDLNGRPVPNLTVNVLDRQGLLLNSANRRFTTGAYDIRIREQDVPSTDQEVTLQFRSVGRIPVDVEFVHGRSNNDINVVLPISRPKYYNVPFDFQRMVIDGARGTHHLAGPLGTSSYWMNGQYWLTTIKLSGSDENFIYYQEIDAPNRRWAFARQLSHEFVRFDRRRCMCYCGFRVWARSDEGARWAAVDWAQRLVPANANASAPKVQIQRGISGDEEVPIKLSFFPSIDYESINAPAMRMWVDASGRRSTLAELIGVSGELGTFRREDGSVAVATISRLSAYDQRRVLNWRASRE